MQEADFKLDREKQGQVLRLVIEPGTRDWPVTKFTLPKS